MLVGTDYNGVGKLQYLFGQENLPILDSRYTESVEFEVLVPKKEEERIKSRDGSNERKSFCHGRKRTVLCHS